MFRLALNFSCSYEFAMNIDANKGVKGIFGYQQINPEQLSSKPALLTGMISIKKRL
jgi:hypothetical protein